MKIKTRAAIKMTFCCSITPLALIVILSAFQSKKHPAVLVFSKTTGFHHASIPAGIAAIQKLGRENAMEVDTTTDSKFFNEKALRKYNAVIFLSTTGNLFNDEEKEALKSYIKSGHGYVGIHAATDAEYQWPWYGGLAGAYFSSHPKIQQATLRVMDASDRSTKDLPKEWTRTDEWYNFKDISKDIHVLLTIDEKSYQGGTNGDFHPMAWYHLYEGGRAFYTELGHTEESYSDPVYLKHLLGGIQYAIGEK